MTLPVFVHFAILYLAAGFPPIFRPHFGNITQTSNQDRVEPLVQH